MTLPAVDRTPAATRSNKTGVLLAGLLLLVAGGLGLAVGWRAFGTQRAGQPVLDPTVRTFAAEHDWFWLAVAGVALVAAVLGWRWLRVQVATTTLRRLDLEADRSRGATVLQAGALQSAAADDLTRRRGIADADARLVGSRHEPQLVLSVTLDGREPLRAVDAEVRAEVVPRIRQAMDQADLPVRLEYRLAPRPYRRTV